MEESGSVNLRLALARKTTQLDALNDSMLEILAGLKQGEVLGHVLASAAACIPAADSGLVAVAEGSAGSLNVGASYGFDPQDIERSSWLKSLAGDAGKEHSPETSGQPSGAPLPGGRRAVTVSALEGSGKKLGFFGLFSIFPDAFTERDSQVLHDFATVASLAVRDAQLLAEIESLGVSDPLTGLLNRQGFNELAEREFKRACRFGQPLAMLKIEVDELKTINDRYGRAVGDQLLRGVGRRLQHQLRAVDLIGRCGPGVFHVVLAETTAGKAAWVMNRIRRSLMDAQYETRRGEMKISVSAGTASLEQGCSSITQLVEWADLARLKHS